MKSFRGITLPEIILGITIAAVSGGLLINMLVSSNSLFFDQSIKIRQGLSLNQATREVTSLIKSSAGVVNQYPPSGAEEYTTNSETLVLKIPAINQTGAIIDQVFDYAVLSKDQTNPQILRKRVITDDLSVRNEEDKVLSTALEEVEFIYLDSSNVEVAPVEAVRINFTINLAENTGSSINKSNSSSTANSNN